MTPSELHPSEATYFLMISRGLRSCSLPGRSADTELCLVLGLMLPRAALGGWEGARARLPARGLPATWRGRVGVVWLSGL